MIDRAIIMLTDRRFWGRASGPSSSGKTLHYWYAHAARRSALPRERFSPVEARRTQSAPQPMSPFEAVDGAHSGIVCDQLGHGAGRARETDEFPVATGPIQP